MLSPNELNLLEENAIYFLENMELRKVLEFRQVQLRATLQVMYELSRNVDMPMIPKAKVARVIRTLQLNPDDMSPST
jgi:regulator of replication initiation timing